ncbi:hypothetical protein [Gordonia sp. SL306]|uniref:hypothetical protein n=1 Tax=Gordonia sp. SL306 TaxID=2995145 RepID=UPI002270522C|nr:hypothetical protein [Gordonia sp. SL306]WAC54433.1 hypothetical protein OVA31_17385 [Gordonia sp. SL306]
MKRQSNTVPVLVFGIGLLALIAALVGAVVPFPTDGSGAPTAAFTAQQELDDVAFQLGGSPGARYSGSLTTTGVGADAKPRTVDFTDLTVASTKNAAGTITYESSTAQYRQIGNYRYVNGPAKLWSDLFGTAPVATRLDLGVTDNKWSNLRYSGLPDLGYLLSPVLLAGRIGNTERVKTPEFGLEIPAPNKGLPDARSWPTTDPVITGIGDDRVRVGSMETTFDPTTKRVTHIKGEFTRSDTTVTVDTDVTLLPAGELGTLFTEERSLVPQLTSVPAPAVPLSDNAVNSRAGGSCTPASCGFVIAVNGALDPDVATDMRGVAGHVNFGITVRFAVDDLRPGERGGICSRVVSTPFGGRAETTCAATNLPPGSRGVRTDTSVRFLPFVDVGAAELNEYIDSQEKSSTTPITMVRTGSKKFDAARYSDQVAGFPSSYGVEQGDYVFDGVGPEGNLFVSFGPGYAQHVVLGRLDPSWPGTALLTKQLKQQLAAAGDREITYVAAEDEVATALRILALTEGASPEKLKVFSTPLNDA